MYFYKLNVSSLRNPDSLTMGKITFSFQKLIKKYLLNQNEYFFRKVNYFKLV